MSFLSVPVDCNSHVFEHGEVLHYPQSSYHLFDPCASLVFPLDIAYLEAKLHRQDYRQSSQNRYQAPQD